jgi:hypothetical protein
MQTGADLESVIGGSKDLSLHHEEKNKTTLMDGIFSEGEPYMIWIVGIRMSCTSVV